MDYLLYDLTNTALADTADATLLSEDERTLAAKRGDRYVLTRCLLRQELARRLGKTPQSIRLRYNAHGKPECEGIHFNISHSGDRLAMAFDERPIGIDIERIRSRKRLDSLASRIMCGVQLAAFRQRGCPVDEFYACWCAAEALVKQSGESIWQAAQHPFVYEYGHIRQTAIGGTPTPRIDLFTPAPGYQGAVAYFDTDASLLHT